MDRNGKEEALGAPANAYSEPRISPDGTRVALSAPTGNNTDIWIWDLVRKTLTRLTFDENIDSNPLWTPDGKRIVFYSNRQNSMSVYWKAADGTGKDELLASATGNYIPRSWSGDGKTLVLMTGHWPNYNIGALSMEGDRKYRPLLQEKYNESDPKISPNGRWMAYMSDESDRAEVYVRPFPDVDGGRWQVSTSGGNNPLWSRDGRELFYRSGDAVMAVPVKTEPSFSLETPKVLFRGTYGGWDISPDGRRFLMIKPPPPAAQAPAAEAPRKINIVLNWFEELKQRVPVK